VKTKAVKTVNVTKMAAMLGGDDPDQELAPSAAEPTAEGASDLCVLADVPGQCYGGKPFDDPLTF
jgi:hypothetical protein